MAPICFCEDLSYRLMPNFRFLRVSLSIAIKLLSLRRRYRM